MTGTWLWQPGTPFAQVVIGPLMLQATDISRSSYGSRSVRMSIRICKHSPSELTRLREMRGEDVVTICALGESIHGRVMTVVPCDASNESAPITVVVEGEVIAVEPIIGKAPKSDAAKRPFALGDRVYWRKPNTFHRPIYGVVSEMREGCPIEFIADNDGCGYDVTVCPSALHHMPGEEIILKTAVAKGPQNSMSRLEAECYDRAASVCCGQPMRPTGIARSGSRESLLCEKCERFEHWNGNRTPGPWWKQPTRLLSEGGPFLDDAPTRPRDRLEYQQAAICAEAFAAASAELAAEEASTASKRCACRTPGTTALLMLRYDHARREARCVACGLLFKNSNLRNFVPYVCGVCDRPLERESAWQVAMQKDGRCWTEVRCKDHRGMAAPPTPVSLDPSVAGIRAKLNLPALDPLDVLTDGVKLRALLEGDEFNRRESGSGHWRAKPMTPAQRAAVSAHHSAELRAKVAASATADREREARRVLVDMEGD